jgi:hypothetical protein
MKKPSKYARREGVCGSASALIDARGRRVSWWKLCREFDRAFEQFKRLRGGHV